MFGDSDIPHLDRADRITKTDVEASFECGLLHLRANRRSRAIESWRRCLTYSRKHADLVLSLGRGGLDDETLANEVIPSDPVLLLQVARKQRRINPNSNLAQLAAKRVLDMQNQTTTDEPQHEYNRGAAAAILGEPSRAARHYGNAVRSRPNQTEWRYQYATTLCSIGDLGEAQKQLQWCLGVNPSNSKYRRLMKNLKKNMETVSDL